MSKWQPIWLALCVAIAYAANRGLAPKVGYEMALAARTMPTGALKLSVSGHAQELKLATVVIVADALRPLLASERPVRVLWLRGTEDGQGGEPDVELFVDLIDGSFVPDVAAGDLGFLRDRALPVLERAPGSTARSRVRLPGDSAARTVQHGSLNVTRVLALDAGTEGARSRVEGRLQLSFEAGDPQMIDGTFDVRVAR
jgi:hypothetical protein